MKFQAKVFESHSL